MPASEFQSTECLFDPTVWAKASTSLSPCASQKMEEAAVRAATEEQRREISHMDLQDRFRLDLEREKLVTSQCDT